MALTTEFVPTTYDEMFRHYFTYILRLVQSRGIEPQAAEDVAMAIVEKFLANDAMADFDPDHFRDQGRKAMFRFFVSGFTMKYVRYHLERQHTRSRREPVRFEAYDQDLSDQPSHQRSGADAFVKPYVERHDDLMVEDLLTTIRARLAAVPVRATSIYSPTEFFEMVLLQIEERGVPDVSELADLYGVSKTSIQNWLKHMRSVVREVTS